METEQPSPLIHLTHQVV